jgi:hypothetical protein
LSWIPAGLPAIVYQEQEREDKAQLLQMAEIKKSAGI